MKSAAGTSQRHAELLLGNATRTVFLTAQRLTLWIKHRHQGLRAGCCQVPSDWLHNSRGPPPCLIRTSFRGTLLRVCQLCPERILPNTVENLEVTGKPGKRPWGERVRGIVKEQAAGAGGNKEVSDRRGSQRVHRGEEQMGKTFLKLWLLLGVRWPPLENFKQRNKTV